MTSTAINYFSWALEAGESEIRASADLVPGESSSFPLHSQSSLLCPHMEDGKGEPSGVSFIKSLISCMSTCLMISSLLIGHHLLISRWGLVFKVRNLGETQTFNL